MFSFLLPRRVEYEGFFSCSPARVLVGKVIEEGRKEEEEGGREVRWYVKEQQTTEPANI